MTKPCCLVILDGWGVREDTANNGIAMAATPFYDYLWSSFPHTTLHASESHVGLPDGQMGNSEVGHMTIGAGKNIDTDLVRINKAIENGNFKNNPAFFELFNHIHKHNSTLHVLGLVSPGGVHSHHSHLHAFLALAKSNSIDKIVIHAFTDGRDVAPQSAADYLEELENVLEELGIGHIATTGGRYYGMDRDKNWERMKKAEDAIFNKVGKIHQGKKPSEAYRELYADNILDEYAEPMVFLDDSGTARTLEPNDGIFYFNFRSDRGRQFAHKVLERAEAMNFKLATMTEFDPAFNCLVAFPKIGIETTLAAEISKAGLSQAHIAETDKYAHVTYFFNGGREQPHPGEEHVMVESRKDVPTYDLSPKMRAEAITDKACERINQGVDALIINYANADLVGHTANQEAIQIAIEEVDIQLKRLYETIELKGGLMMITADHGNAEVMVDPETGEKHTSHTTNKVPAIITKQGIQLREGSLADIAPTVLELMGLPKPTTMTGISLIV